MRCGLEFGEHKHTLAVIVCALYEFTISAERFRTILADFLRTLGFVPSRFEYTYVTTVTTSVLIFMISKLLLNIPTCGLVE